MILNAHTVRNWERCRRLGVWGLDWHPTRMTPYAMVMSALRNVIESTDYHGPAMAREHVMELAGRRGVLTNRGDPYAQVVHYAHMAEVIARTLRQPTAGPLTRHPTVDNWKPESWLDPSGTRLVRVILADRWDEDREMSELHDWATIGDVCVTRLPMTMKIVVVGNSSQGKRHGHWTRGLQHPYTKEIRFGKRHSKGEQFSESYRAVWREEIRISSDKWLEGMARDGVLKEVAFTRNVLVPSDRQREQVVRDIDRIAAEMVASRGVLFPMTRSACDLAGPGRSACLYQSVCYSPMEIEIEETGIFERNDNDHDNGL